MSEDLKQQEANSSEAPVQQKEKVPMTKDQEEFVEKIEKMSVMELSSLVKVMEEKFGVSAQAPMMVAQAGSPAGGAAAGAAGAEEVAGGGLAGIAAPVGVAVRGADRDRAADGVAEFRGVGEDDQLGAVERVAGDAVHAVHAATRWGGDHIGGVYHSGGGIVAADDESAVSEVVRDASQGGDRGVGDFGCGGGGGVGGDDEYFDSVQRGFGEGYQEVRVPRQAGGVSGEVARVLVVSLTS